MEIRRLCKAGLSRNKIAARLGMAPGHIGRVIRGIAWKHICALSKETTNLILHLYNEFQMSIDEIAANTGEHPDNVKRFLDFLEIDLAEQLQPKEEKSYE